MTTAAPRGETLATEDQTILVVDDDRAVRSLFTTVLERNGFACVEADSGRRALEVIANHAVATVLLDSRMPEMDGVEVLRVLRERPDTRTLPVIFVTGEGEVDRRVRALEAGADDYLAKPVSTAELVARVRAQLRGQAEWMRLLEERMRERTDLLAELAQLRPDERLEATAAAVLRRLVALPSVDGAVMTLFGRGGVAIPVATAGSAAAHPEGRALPAGLARYLRDSAERGPWIEQEGNRALTERTQIRVLPPEATSAAFAPLVARDDLLGVLGVVEAASGSDDPSRALALAIDVATIAAALVVTQRDDWQHSAATRQHIDDLLRRQAFDPVFQPIRRLSDLAVESVEALTRFSDGVDPQTRFLEAAQVGCGGDLERATLVAALRAAEALPAGLGISLNVSPALLTEDPGLPERLRAAGRPITLELTEHDRIDDYTAVRRAIDGLGEDVRLSVDDAGAGYASLTHVLTLAPHCVKLDRTWVRGIEEDPARQALVAGLVHFARSTGSTLVAEGIETKVELATLRHLGVELGQGYLLGRPTSTPDLGASSSLIG